jgi:hypothetical protein
MNRYHVNAHEMSYWPGFLRSKGKVIGPPESKMLTAKKIIKNNEINLQKEG